MGLPRYTAVYVLQGPEGAILIETSSAVTTENIVAGLREIGLDPKDIKHVLVSHIHLDHAGAAWWWAQQGAQIHVHEFGAQHLIDPSALVASATRIYTDRMDTLWGPVQPIAPEKVLPVHDGDVINVCGLKIKAIEAPGHARHHHAFALSTIDHGKICFTGDACAMIMPEGDYLAVPTPPPEFDLELWLETLQRLETCNFDTLYPTHFGPYLGPPATLLHRLRDALIEQAEFVRVQMETGKPRQEIFDAFVAWQREVSIAQGTSEKLYQDYTVDHLMEMNTTGLMRYWTKKNR